MRLARCAGVALAVVLGCGDDCGEDDGSTVSPPSGLDLWALDRNVDPCADFYRFACGGWIDRHPVPADGAVVSVYQEPFYEAVPLLWQIVVDDVAGAASADDPYARIIGDHYASCLEAPSSTSASDELRALIEEVNALTTLDGVAEQAAAQRALGSGTFFGLSVVVDPGDSGRYVLAVDQGGFELGDRSYYLDPSPEYEELRAAYLAHIDNLAALVGTSIDAAAALRVETMLAEAALPPEDRRDPQALYHPMTGAELAALAPSFPWTAFWEASGYSVPDRVDVVVPDYFVALEDVLASPIEDLRAYMQWQLLQDRAEDLHQAVLDEDFAFWSRFTGRAEPWPRDWTCFVATLDWLGDALAQPYIARHFDERTVDLAEDAAESVRRAFAGRIAQASWLDEPTRAEAMTKLESVRFKLGHPEVWQNYQSVSLSPESLFHNHNALIARWQTKARARLGMAVDRSEWLGSPLDVNAWYSQELNDVTMTALYLSPPLVVVGASKARNAGVLASVIGHEITHGFDDAGRDYDASGNLRDWWSRAAEIGFANGAECVVDQFDAYEVLPGEYVNGELTAGENIADLGGAIAGYYALMEDDPGPGGDGFTAEQVYFIAYAQKRCENARPEWVSATLLTDPHAPNSLRVNGPLSNMPEFAEAFQCGAGSPMVRPEPCRVW